VDPEEDLASAHPPTPTRANHFDEEFWSSADGDDHFLIDIGCVENFRCEGAA